MTHAHGCANQLPGFFGILTFTLAAVVFCSHPLLWAAGNWSQKPSWASSRDRGNDRERDRDEPATLFSSGSSSGASASRRAVIKEDRKEVTPFSPGSNNLSLGVGQTFLMGDMGSQYTDAIGTRLTYTLGVSEMFALEAAIGYSSHAQNGDVRIPKNYSMTTALAGMRVNLSWYDKVVPHAVIGMGFFNPSYEINDKGLTYSPVVFGIHVGPGIDLQLTKQIFFGASLRFHDLFSSVRYIQETAERREIYGTFTSLLLHTGVSF